MNEGEISTAETFPWGPVNPDIPVAYRLSAEKKGSAIILDENDDLYGIFTTTDALNALVELLLPQKYSNSNGISSSGR